MVGLFYMADIKTIPSWVQVSRVVADPGGQRRRSVWKIQSIRGGGGEDCPSWQIRTGDLVRESPYFIHSTMTEFSASKSRFSHVYHM